MRRSMLLGLVASVMLVVSAAMAASAFAAAANPEFFVEGASLTSGAEVQASATTNQVLKAPSITIECTTLSITSGSQLLPGGLNEESLIYTGCGVPGKANCKVRSERGGVEAPVGTIETEALDSELVYKNKSGAEKEEGTQTGTLFRPASGTLFTRIVVGPSGSCPLGTAGTHEVKGEVLVENEASEAEAASHTLTAPTAALKHYWLNNEELGGTEEHSVSTLTVTAFGSSTYSGSSIAKMGSEEEWHVGPTETHECMPQTKEEPGF